MNFIVAVDNNYAIGKKGGLIYSLPSDLKYFKQVTSGKVVVMGERTYLSLPKRPLPNRINIVLCDRDVCHEGALVVHNFSQLKRAISKYKSDDVFVIGGASVYNALMDYCKYAYITKIDAADEGADTFIHNIDKRPNWKMRKCSPKQSENNLSFAFCVYENCNTKKLR